MAHKQENPTQNSPSTSAIISDDDADVEVSVSEPQMPEADRKRATVVAMRSELTKIRKVLHGTHNRRISDLEVLKETRCALIRHKKTKRQLSKKLRRLTKRFVSVSQELAETLAECLPQLE